MKRKLLYVRLISASLLMMVFSPVFGQKEACDFPLQGRVKSVFEVVYEATTQNGIIAKGKLLSDSQDTIYYQIDGTRINAVAIQPFTMLSDSVAYQYDNTGKCIKMVVFYPNKQLRESRTLVYNEQGNVKLCIIRSTSDEVVDAISYSYDPYGKLAIKINNRLGGEMSQQRFAYDEKGNWIVRVDFEEYDPIYYIERHIEYYPD